MGKSATVDLSGSASPADLVADPPQPVQMIRDMARQNHV
uniref:Uncharacterized protein n=1 Tax=uncultured bacterium A1Q1_fos_291 TaxID=1256570 RepID=L7W0P4_9BACT|nr:hypothetical protein [uncultured bacterium A1Q1_fos_291]